MPALDDRPTDAGPLDVHLPSLRGYAGLVGGVGADLGLAAAHADSHCAQGDFGKMLEDLTADYSALLPRLRDVLAEDARLVTACAGALSDSARVYSDTDARVALDFDRRRATVTGGDGVSGHFRPRDSPPLGTPAPDVGALPAISLGFPFDEVADALRTWVGLDLRGSLTDWIVGDVEGLATQATAWDQISTRLDDCRLDLDRGASLIDEEWSGYAARVTMVAMGRWQTALADQGARLGELAGHLREIAQDAVDTAQIVVDCLRLVIDLVMMGIAQLYVPLVGQARLIKKCWDAYKLANKAISVLKAFLSALKVVKDYVVVLLDTLSPSSLPPAPLEFA